MPQKTSAINPPRPALPLPGGSRLLLADGLRCPSPAALDAWAIKKLGKPVMNTSQEES